MDMKDKDNMDMQALMKRIGSVRRASGLSQYEFSERANVPVFYTEIAEHGAYSSCEDVRLGMDGLFSEMELEKILKGISDAFGVSMEWLKYGEGETALGETSMDEDELVFYFPITVSVKSIVEDLKRLTSVIEARHFPEPELNTTVPDRIVLLLMEFKAYYAQMKRIGRMNVADKARNGILEIISGHMAI